MFDKTLSNPQSAVDRLQQLREFTTILNQQNRFEEILRVAAQKLGAFLRAELTVILMLNSQTRQTVKTIHKEAKRLREPRYRAVQTQVSGWIHGAQ